MPSHLTTSLPVFYYDAYPVWAEVIGADATATTYVLNCPPGTDGNDCGTYNNTVTLGPWASKTLPAGAASTGDFDLFVTMAYEDPWKFSLHCEMSRTIAKECTTINIGGNDDGHPTATITASDDLEGYNLAHGPVTITAGQELLSAKHTGVAKASASATDASQTESSGSETTGTETSGAATPVNTSAASSSFARIFGAMSVAGVAAALVMS
ncbi:hypothetical protein FSARC_5495 [Fusarium sarcochroum]|uniref:Uncharacterized protein n=1 Tax=Fusarium sarcochroum TaxID=1208366 RepID=A0A8H4TZE7_9HYPO|nr:hypothetical protein FSARC_5495 [Fusarium sarcochroum]